MRAARLKIQHTLSYADAFAVVTIQECQGTLLTGDPELLQLTGSIAIETLTLQEEQIRLPTLGGA
jgi:predicted nucleic acid-binding protein